MHEITIIDKDNISLNDTIYYGGWSDTELKNIESNYQTRFFGSEKDLTLKVITDDFNSYLLICRAGESFKNQSQFVFHLLNSAVQLL